ncbi:MAG: hypothetical protein JNL51_04910 [Chitinophagaceae bacterium]|nr:hypothetical protein [Chitinophagaceae bacterium]
MEKLAFFSRVALICNGCFVLAFLAQRLPFASNGFMMSTVIVLGNAVSIALNVIMGVWYLLRNISGMAVSPPVPRWLLMANMLFLVFQLMIFL